MNATRRLDALAVIGSVLAVAVLLVIVVTGSRSVSGVSRNDPHHAFAKLVEHLPESDVRADVAAASLIPLDKDPGDAIAELRRGLRSYPNSSRLYFRLGTLAKGRESVAALEKAVQLDPENALPVYVLAQRRSESGAWDEAARLLDKANRLHRMDAYRMPLEPVGRNVLLETEVGAANSTVAYPVYLSLRNLAGDVSKHALRLHQSGQSRQAIELLESVRQTGWKLAESKDASLMDALIGVTLVRIYEKNARPVLSESADVTPITALDREHERTTYIRAGAHVFTNEVTDKITCRYTDFGMNTLMPFLITLIGYSGMMLCLVADWLIKAIRTRKLATTDLHERAAGAVLPSVRLLRSYVLAFLVLAAGMALLSALNTSTDSIAVYNLLFVAVFSLPQLFLPWLGRRYRKAYQEAAQVAGEPTPRRMKDIPIRDRRELSRWHAGIFGGMMLVALLWAGLFSVYTKCTSDTYPWEMNRVMSGMLTEETKFVRDLVAGKVKVPEKYIREVEQGDKQKLTAPGG